MSAELAENLQPVSDVDRFEAQRQAFSRLMARFTADRDAMIAAVQQCNERIDSIALRLAGGEVPAGADGDLSAGAASAAAGMAEVRALTERFLAQQQHALAEVRTASDRALQRADEAQKRMREMAELAAQREGASEELRQAVDTFDDRLARLEEAVVASDDKEAVALDDEAVRLLAERVAALEEQIRGLERALDDARHSPAAVAAEDSATAPLVSLGLRDLREQMMQLESLAAWTPKLQRLWVSLVASVVITAVAFIYAS